MEIMSPKTAKQLGKMAANMQHWAGESPDRRLKSRRDERRRLRRTITKGQTNGRIIVKTTEHGRDLQLHATKGWRQYRA